MRVSSGIVFFFFKSVPGDAVNIRVNTSFSSPDDVLTEWRGFVQQAGMADAGLVGTLPQVGSGLSQSRRRNTIACVLGDPLVLCVRAKVDTEHYRE